MMRIARPLLAVGVVMMAAVFAVALFVALLAVSSPSERAAAESLAQAIGVTPGAVSATAEIELPEGADPEVNIIYPPPVFAVRGVFPVRGSANVPNLINYFITVRPLDAMLEPIGTDFFPVVLPQLEPVENGILGLWDTTVTPDGVYELRLTIGIRGGETVNVSVSPIRVENDVPAFADEDGDGQPDVITPTPNASLSPTISPTALPGQPPVVVITAVPPFNPTPRVILNVANGNIRTGDSTLFPVIATARFGQEFRIVGISSRGTGWYQIQLPSFALGWISPTIVMTAGDLRGIPFVVPPPLPPPPPTLTPTVTLTGTQTVTPTGTLPTSTQTSTPTRTLTPTATLTGTQTATLTPTLTVTPTLTLTPTVTLTTTIIPTATPSATSTTLPMETPSATATS